ncbi:MAG: hypothetical protein KDN19_20350, partial [Verrucomicrobiae bacterium]|nr:hypothetical protein [Verrucomicrobiae bacterium]
GAFVDLDKDQKYDSGEPAWYHANESGEAIPLPIDPKSGKGRTSGELSTKTIIPDRLVKASQQFQNQNGGSLSELAAGMDLKIALGEIADLNDPKFSSARGEEGLWEPASFPLESGIGIYFLEAYDPKKIPVLFVYGMSGSPQDWRTFFRDIDRSRFQPWFFYYPTGRRLDEMGEALNRGIKLLHRHYGFAHLKVVAHSMGGLVSRSFVTKNVLEDGNRYIDRFITISSPWGGHEAAAMGVKHAPKVVPSWYDMQTGSKFQQDLYEKRLRGVVDHHLIFGYAGEKSMSLPSSNDGTVSVASELFPAVQSDVVSVAGFNSDHVGILSNPDVIALVGQYLTLDGTSAPPAPQTSSERKGLLKLLPALP